MIVEPSPGWLALGFAGLRWALLGRRRTRVVPFQDANTGWACDLRLAAQVIHFGRTGPDCSHASGHSSQAVAKPCRPSHPLPSGALYWSCQIAVRVPTAAASDVLAPPPLCLSAVIGVMRSGLTSRSRLHLVVTHRGTRRANLKLASADIMWSAEVHSAG